MVCGGVRSALLAGPAAAALLAGLAGCGADTGEPGGPDGGHGAPDAAASGCAALPDPGPAWLRPYQEDLVARLSGAAEIEAGVQLADRASPAARAAALAYLEAELLALGLEPERHDYGGGTNLHATLAGDAPGGATIVIGAHYDSVPGSPGANDNATGVAMVLAAARHLADIDCRTRDVSFVLFDQEEIGLVGSDRFAALLAARGTEVHAVHTIDQMGWDGDGDRALELERPDPGLYELYARSAIDAGMSLTLTVTETGQTDHVSFRARGFDAIGLTEEFVSGDTTPHYHLPGDTFETVSLDYLASSSELLLHTAARAARGLDAERGQPIERAAPVTGERRRCGGSRDHGRPGWSIELTVGM